MDDLGSGMRRQKGISHFNGILDGTTEILVATVDRYNLGSH